MKKILLLTVLSLMLLSGCHGKGEVPQPQNPPANPGTTEQPDAPLTYTVVYEATEGGRILGEATQTVTEGESTSSVIAMAESGWVFVGWSDGVSQRERSESNVTENMKIIARFAESNSSGGGVDLPDLPIG